MSIMDWEDVSWNEVITQCTVTYTSTCLHCTCMYERQFVLKDVCEQLNVHTNV